MTNDAYRNVGARVEHTLARMRRRVLPDYRRTGHDIGADHYRRRSLDSIVITD